MEIEIQFIWVEGDPLPEVGEGAPVELLDNDPDFVEEFRLACRTRLETFQGVTVKERMVILEIDDVDIIGAFALAPKIQATIRDATMPLTPAVEPVEAMK